MKDATLQPGLTHPPIVGRVIEVLYAPRSPALLLAVSLALGTAYALTIVPLAFIDGSSSFWSYPPGTRVASGTDMAEYLVGYLYLMKAPWSLPLLFAPNLNAPEGTNVFWLDTGLLSLLGHLVWSVTGRAVNLFGPYIFLCLALPGVAMTALLAVAGQRGLLAAIAGTAIAEATPYLLFRWGHVPAFGQFWIIVGLALYLANRRRPLDTRIAAAWIVVLCIVLLTNVYLFAMVSACWFAALVQRWLGASISSRRVFGEAACAISAAFMVMALTGILSPDLGSAGTDLFGYFTMNLASPVVPQMSGLVPPLADTVIGMPGQYEGYAWVGGGVLLLAAVSCGAWWQWLHRRARRHVVIIAIFTCFLLLALSNRIYLFNVLLLDIPLPAAVNHALGTFRSSGRFFWPIGYALAAGSILLVLRGYRPAISMPLLIAASVLQLVDTAPLRAAIVASASGPAPATIDRAKAASLVGRARAVMVFPSFDCAAQGFGAGLYSGAEANRITVLNMEFELLAARRNLPINSVDSARLHGDCAAESATRRQPLRPGVLYVYFTSFRPDAAQLGRHDPDTACGAIDHSTYCLLPAERD